MVNYQLGKIYKIVGNGLNYVGSTCEPTLARRLAKHVNNYKRYLKGKGRDVTSFQIIESDDYYIELIEAYPCCSKDELLVRERYWTNQIECINKIKNQGLYLQLGKKEYYKQHNKKYCAENKDKLIEMYKNYRENNRSLICAKQQNYYMKNKDIINEKTQQFRKNNKAIMKERDARKYKKYKELISFRKKTRYREKKIV